MDPNVNNEIFYYFEPKNCPNVKKITGIICIFTLSVVRFRSTKNLSGIQNKNEEMIKIKITTNNNAKK